MIQMDMVFTFLKCYYSNIWIIHVQSFTNFLKSMWELVFNVDDVIFKFGSCRNKVHKVHRNNAPFKTFKKMLLEQKNWKTKKKLQLIWTYENMVKFKPFKSP